MSEKSEILPVEIRKLQNAEEARICAQFMVTSEPWITLHRTYDDSLKILRDPSKEVYVAVSGEMVVGFIIINMNGHFIGYIQTVCTGPAWRRKGIGSQLLAFAEE